MKATIRDLVEYPGVILDNDNIVRLRMQGAEIIPSCCDGCREAGEIQPGHFACRMEALRLQRSGWTVNMTVLTDSGWQAVVIPPPMRRVSELFSFLAQSELEELMRASADMHWLRNKNTGEARISCFLAKAAGVVFMIGLVCQSEPIITAALYTAVFALLYRIPSWCGYRLLSRSPERKMRALLMRAFDREFKEREGVK